MKAKRIESEQNGWSRREFLSAVAGAGAAAMLPGCATTTSSASGQKRVALIATEVRLHSHAQHFIDRFLEGFGWEGRWHHPAAKLVSLYVDQFPEGELSRERSKRFGVPIYPTVEEALTCGGSKLAVDGVVIIGEHGKYPKNEMGQTRYPRYEWFKKVVKVFEATGRSVPVFNDKHLSTKWDECAEMVADSKRLRFPFHAGSSLPVTWRIPSVDMPLGTPLVESVSICYGGVDSYDFHGLETAQCMAERRLGGESGVKSVQALKGEKLFARLAQHETTRRLMFSALARSHNLSVPDGYPVPRPTMDWVRRMSPEGIGYFMEHNDGHRTTMLLLNGLVQDFTYAGLDRKTNKIISCQMNLPMPGQSATTADFFNPLVNHIDRMLASRRAPYPVERSLLTSGLTLFAVQSLFRSGALIETPQLSVAYQPTVESTFWRA